MRRSDHYRGLCVVTHPAFGSSKTFNECEAINLFRTISILIYIEKKDEDFSVTIVTPCMSSERNQE